MSKPLLNPQSLMTEKAFRELCGQRGVVISAYAEKPVSNPPGSTAVLFFMHTPAAKPPKHATMLIHTPSTIGHEEREYVGCIPTQKISSAFSELGLL